MFLANSFCTQQDQSHRTLQEYFKTSQLSELVPLSLCVPTLDASPQKERLLSIPTSIQPNFVILGRINRASIIERICASAPPSNKLESVILGFCKIPTYRRP
jgi:hypothetical protein